MAIDKYKLKDGSTRYRVSVYINGQRVAQKRGFEKLKDAKAYEASVISKGKANKRITYQDAEDMYLDAYMHAHKESSYYAVRKRLANKVPPEWRKRDISAISTIECQRLANHLSDQYLSASSYISTISEVFKFAKNQMDAIEINPFDKIIKPKKHEATHVPDLWTNEQLHLFLETARQFRRPEAYPLFRLMAYTGLRRGEIVAIKWQDIHGDIITIHDNMTIDRNGHEIIDSPKTENSTRTIAIDPETALAIETLRENAKDERVFPIGLNCLRKWLVEIEKQAGIPHNQSHNFRRNHGTQLLNSGAPIKDVQDRLGHKDAAATLAFYARSNRDKRSILKYIEK